MTLTPVAPTSATGVVHGEVITQRWVVEMILDLVGYSPERDLAVMRIVEPSAGTGAFLGPIVERLVASARRNHPDDLGAVLMGRALCANELQPGNVKVLRDLVVQKLTGAGVDAGRAVDLAMQWVSEGDYLACSPARKHGSADFVVGNPPYIRLEDLGAARWRAYQDAAPTMRGRADIYVAFFELGLRELKHGGSLGYVCADRWMRNDYGKSLRNHITRNGFSVDAVVTLHDAPAFEREVDAYPAVTVVSRRQQGPALIVDTTSRFSAPAAQQLVDFAREARCGPLVTEQFHAAHLADWHEPGTAGWPTGTPEAIAWLRQLARCWPTIEETGARIGIGVATGADAIYVTPRGGQVPLEVEPDRILPLAHTDDIRSGTWRWTGRYLINPWLADGLIDLADSPGLGRYLAGHPRVRQRNVARRNPTKWHRTIDRVNLALMDRRLVLMQDMSAEVRPVVAPSGYYPHHNLYFLDVHGSPWTPESLAGLLLSDQARTQIEAHCVLMRGRTLRLQAQYLRRVRVPKPAELEPGLLAEMERAYDTRDRRLATDLFSACERQHGETSR